MFAVPLIGGAVSAIGAIQGAGAAAKAAEYNAAISRTNARMSRDEAQVEIADRHREMRQTLGSIRAAYGSSGVQFAGSGMDLLRDSAVEYAYDTAKIGYKGEVRAISETNQAKLSMMEAKQARTAGYFGAATSLLKGAAGAYGMYRPGSYGQDLAPMTSGGGTTIPQVSGFPG